jgi:hypothetical protein
MNAAGACGHARAPAAGHAARCLTGLERFSHAAPALSLRIRCRAARPLVPLPVPARARDEDLKCFFFSGQLSSTTGAPQAGALLCYYLLTTGCIVCYCTVPGNMVSDTPGLEHNQISAANLSRTPDLSGNSRHSRA